MSEADLRTLLDSLDACRKSLHGWLQFWTWLVVVGVALEFSSLLKEYRNELHDFRRGIVRPPDKPNLFLFLVGFFGIALVVAGVSGELVIDAKLGTLETRIQKADNDLYSLLSQEAGDAATSARTAHDLGADLLGKYKSAEREIIDLKAARLPRRLSSAQKVLLRKKVAAFRVKDISISCIDGGREAFRFAQDFVDAFRSPQSPVHTLKPYPDFCIEVVGGSVYSPPIGIGFGDGRESDAETLLRALVEIGISKKQIAIKHANSNAQPTLGITIGPKGP